MAFALAVALAWLFFDSQGLPNMQSLAQFAPAEKALATGPCLNTPSIAIPYELIGNNLRSALGAAAIPEDGPGVAAAIFQGLSSQRKSNPASLSMQIARTSFCGPARQLDRDAGEIRLAVRLDSHFTQRQLFTIFANRLFFGEKIVGVESASQHYFHKEPDQLLLGEAALLAGIAQGPSRYSPAAHPDRALLRRNQVIDAMAELHLISASEASAAKAAPLGVLSE
jgi:membrane carboxypeptidase/penicillin-binding protein